MFFYHASFKSFGTSPFCCDFLKTLLLGMVVSPYFQYSGRDVPVTTWLIWIYFFFLNTSVLHIFRCYVCLMFRFLLFFFPCACGIFVEFSTVNKDSKYFRKPSFYSHWLRCHFRFIKAFSIFNSFLPPNTFKDFFRVFLHVVRNSLFKFFFTIFFLLHSL